jgi:hypothetical protein
MGGQPMQSDVHDLKNIYASLCKHGQDARVTIGSPQRISVGRAAPATQAVSIALVSYAPQHE